MSRLARDPKLLAGALLFLPACEITVGSIEGQLSDDSSVVSMGGGEQSPSDGSPSSGEASGDASGSGTNSSNESGSGGAALGGQSGSGGSASGGRSSGGSGSGGTASGGSGSRGTASGGSGSGGTASGGSGSGGSGSGGDGGMGDPLAEQVSWDGLTGAEISADGSPTCTNNVSYGCRAYSTQFLAGTEDGYFEFAARNGTGLFGLSDDPDDAHPFNQIDFAIQLWTESNVYVVEGGSQRGQQTTWLLGDVFRVEFSGGTVLYKKNGVTFYTSTETPIASNYHADFATGLIGRGIDAPVFRAPE